MKFRHPVDSPFRISQRFGENPQYYRKFGFPGHEGVDYAVNVGTPVHAPANGTVYQVRKVDNHPYGWHMRLRHRDPDTGIVYETIFAHLSRFMMKEGQAVQSGDIIALSGNTGTSTTGPHLHFTVKKLGATASGETKYPKDVVNPEPFMEQT
jgi:murein DD-endopeptidase MepM/ murein hydrolase activator NlpD